MRTLLSLANGIDRVSVGLGRAVSWLVLLMVLVGAFNAVARYGGRYIGANLSSNGLVDLQWYLFSLVFLLGASYTLQRDAHVRVDVFYGRLGRRGKAWIDLVGTLVFLLPFCAFAFWTSLPTVRSSWEVLEMSPNAGGLPRYPIKTAIPVAFVLLFVQGVAQAAHNLARLSERDNEDSDLG